MASLRSKLRRYGGHQLLVLVALAGCRGTLPAMPEQPASGPGGSDYDHASTRIALFGDGAASYWIVTPDAPQPAVAPVVVFMHGWGGMTPVYYGAWIEHIARKGYIVVYPRYQERLTDSVGGMPDAALTAIQDAVARLERDGPVSPDPTGMAWVGHSLGGFIAAALVPVAEAEGLPAPNVLMVCHPGNGDRFLPSSDERVIELERLDGVPSSLLGVVVVGDSDWIVGTRYADVLVDAYAELGIEGLDFVTVQSDKRGLNKLEANHFAPVAADGTYAQASRISRWRADRLVRKRSPDALDYYGYWKLFDGLLDAAFRGINRDYALGGTQRQRFMGRFADGVAVQPLLVRTVATSETN